MLCFPLSGPRKYPVYLSDEHCDAFGINTWKIKDADRNVVAISVMFRMDIAVMVFAHVGKAKWTRIQGSMRFLGYQQYHQNGLD